MDTVEKTSSSIKEQFEELLELVAFINEFRSIKRVIWYRGNDERELNGDHSFQLAFVSWFVATNHLPHLDAQAVVFMALVHDLPEVYAEDTPLFEDPTGKIPSGPPRATKEKREREAVLRIEREWGERFPELIHYLHRYQRRMCEESRLICALDKLVSATNVFQDEGRAWKRLEVTLPALDTKKRVGIRKHPHIAALYQELFALLRTTPQLFEE